MLYKLFNTILVVCFGGVGLLRTRKPYLYLLTIPVLFINKYLFHYQVATLKQFLLLYIPFSLIYISLFVYGSYLVWTEPVRTQRWWQRWYSGLIICVLVAFILDMSFQTKRYQTFVQPTDRAAPYLHKGDNFVVDTLAYQQHPPRNVGDLVTANILGTDAVHAFKFNGVNEKGEHLLIRAQQEYRYLGKQVLYKGRVQYVYWPMTRVTNY